VLHCLVSLWVNSLIKICALKLNDKRLFLLLWLWGVIIQNVWIPNRIYKKEVKIIMQSYLNC